jgi:hemerythrin
MFVIWSPLFEINVPRIDHEHRNLAEILNEFHRAHAEGHEREQCFHTLNRLVQYVEEHFSSEETLMREARYPEFMKHRVEHDKLTKRIFELNEGLADGDDVISDDLLEFLKKWLIDHILHTDMKLKEYFQSNPIPDPWTSPGH